MGQLVGGAFRAVTRRRGRGLAQIDRGNASRGPRRARWALASIGVITASAIIGSQAEGATLWQMIQGMGKPQPAPAPAPTTTTTTAPPVSGASGDTGYTRIRLAFDNRASWAYVSFDNLTIKDFKSQGTTGSTKITSSGPSIAIGGSGTAVMDLVLYAAPDAVTGLSLCSSAEAYTKLTVTRMTDAATVIGNYTKNAQIPQPQSGSCQHQSLSRSAFMGSTRWPARVDSRRLVLAEYFPWWDASNLNSPNFMATPTGPADTSDPTQVGAAMDMARANGVDGYVVEYEGSPVFDPHIDLAYQAADARPGFNIAMQIDFEILYWRNGGVPDSVLDEVLQATMARSSHASQLRVNGQPVLYVYYGGRVAPSAWQAALDRLYTSTGIRPYVMVDVTGGNLGAPARFAFGNNGDPDADSLNRTAADTLFHLRLDPGLNGLTIPLWNAAVQPGFDNSRSGVQPVIVEPRNGGQRYADTWNATLTELPEWILITSWNGYDETTQIMPDAVNGTLALQQTATFAAQFHKSG
jgi:hypothetical protein